jgi:hypothetical protein
VSASYSWRRREGLWERAPTDAREGRGIRTCDGWRLSEEGEAEREVKGRVSYGHPWAHYPGGYQDRLLGGPLGLLDLCCTVPAGVKRKDCR